MANNYNEDLIEVLRQKREALSLTLRELGEKSGVSVSHLYRIEQGTRFPSARVIRKIAGPLGFKEEELFKIAGLLLHQSPATADDGPLYGGRRLDPYVAAVLSEEPVEIRRTVIGILNVFKSITGSVEKRRKS
ncbi:helix-turn-helix domain-containing protein [Chloroflexota bacterium]